VTAADQLRRSRGYGSATPCVTVVVPAYNEDPALLHRCLLSIDRQDYPEFEAIVVEDGSLNVEEQLPVHDEFSKGRFRVVLQPDTPSTSPICSLVSSGSVAVA
jgi:cellulose synthase/poly-beta-1,6-N-acetylglucosamine synthase-like glycosyltransferase